MLTKTQRARLEEGAKRMDRMSTLEVLHVIRILCKVALIYLNDREHQRAIREAVMYDGV